MKAAQVLSAVFIRARHAGRRYELLAGNKCESNKSPIRQKLGVRICGRWCSSIGRCDRVQRMRFGRGRGTKYSPKRVWLETRNE